VPDIADGFVRQCECFNVNKDATSEVHAKLPVVTLNFETEMLVPTPTKGLSKAQFHDWNRFKLIDLAQLSIDLAAQAFNNDSTVPGNRFILRVSCPTTASPRW
jgi:hypothetical protein